MTSVHEHPELVASAELRRRRNLLAQLEPVERGEVERIARSVAEGVASLLVESSRDEPVLADALASLYRPA